MTIKIFIVDDHQIFRDGLRLLFDNTEDMTVVGEAPSGAEALEKLNQLSPDLILMDIQMPHQSGIEATRALKRQNPDYKILMLTMFEDDQSVFAAMCAGALGYLLKGTGHEEIVHSVRIAAAGGAVFSPRIAEYILQWFAGNGLRGTTESAESLPELTRREREVLKLLAAGSDNNTIADALTVTDKTVRNYVSQLLKKLEVNDRLEAGDKARRAGLE